MIYSINQISCMGTKNTGIDIRDSIKPIISSAKNFILLGTYNISYGSFIYYGLQNNITAKKGIILPNIRTGFDGTLYTINDIYTIIIQYINIGVGVIIDATNHSKFILSEDSIYFGSANLTATALRDNFEVISILNNTIANPNLFYNLRYDFAQTFYWKLMFSPTNLGCENIRILTELKSILERVFKLNPNATKVKRTIDNYDSIINIINYAINDYFKLLSIKDFTRIYIKLENLKTKLTNLVNYGYWNIIRQAELKGMTECLEELEIPKIKIKGYNSRYFKFLDELKKLINYIEVKGDKFKSYEEDPMALKNRELISNIQVCLSNYINNSDEYK